jgi:hypothetical protein
MRKPSRHTFRFKIKTKGEKDKEIRHKAKVIRAKKGVTLTLTAEDVEQSIRLHGAGNCQTCAMAVATKRQADRLPHPFGGFLDWTYSKAHIVSKVNKATGLPSECYAYEHSDDVAKLYDTRAGQKKLLADLRENGPRTVNLRPIKYRPREEGRPRGKNDGSRAPRPAIMNLKGAHRRFAVAQLGGFVA